jgi:hypothetical protein
MISLMGVSQQSRPARTDGIHILLPLVVSYVLLRVVLAFILPALQANYTPVQPPTPPVLSTMTDPELGTAAPPELQGFGFPLKVVAHIDCLSCTTKSDGPVRRLFARPDVLNVVLTSEQDEYKAIGKAFPNAKVLYAGDHLARALNVAFGPRLYVYDSNGLLAHIQGNDVASVEEDLRRD